MGDRLGKARAPDADDWVPKRIRGVTDSLPPARSMTLFRQRVTLAPQSTILRDPHWTSDAVDIR